MEKAQVVNAAYSEMLRYSVAISVQLERIKYWTTELRAGREEWNQASYKAIFESTLPPDQFEAYLRQLKSQFELPPKMHLKSEVQFLVVAVRNVYVMAETVRWGVVDDDESVKCVQSAVSAFEKEVPDAVLLRHLHEHMDEVLKGKGQSFKKLPHPDMEGAIALLDDDVGYEIGGKVWQIGELAVAAKNLVRDVGACLND